jgi:hypothetical protein
MQLSVNADKFHGIQRHKPCLFFSGSNKSRGTFTFLSSSGRTLTRIPHKKEIPNKKNIPPVNPTRLFHAPPHT